LAPVAPDEPEQLELAEVPAEVEVPSIEPEVVVEADVIEEPGNEPAPPEEPAAPKVAPHQTNNKDKRGKPALPSWDDVLLGVRSSGR
jgi:hypothetical protein